jgi:hypothetical protein
LFLIYINELPDATRHECILFADDTTVIIKGTNANNFELDLNTALKDVVTWLNSNSLKINPNKTKFMQFRSYKAKRPDVKVSHDDTEIEEVNSTMFLGLTLDTHCNWKDHVAGVCKKVNKFCYVLWRLKQTVSMKTALMAYHGYIESVLRYGILMWGNSVHADQAFVAQKKCVRAICGARYRESCQPLFPNLNILTLPCLYIFQASIFVKQNPELFPIAGNASNRSLRQYQMQIPPHRLVIRKKSSYIMCIRIFNKIPVALKTLPNPAFKRKLRELLCKCCFYNINDFLCYKF